MTPSRHARVRSAAASTSRAAVGMPGIRTHPFPVAVNDPAKLLAALSFPGVESERYV